MKKLAKQAQNALIMTNNVSLGLLPRPSRTDKQAKRQVTPRPARRGFDPIAYAAALEVLG